MRCRLRGMDTRVRVAAATLLLYVAGASLAYRFRAQADAALAEAFGQNLAVLSELPALQAGLREIDLLADQYLLAGDSARLDERSRSLEAVRAQLGSFAAVADKIGGGPALADLRRALDARLAEQQALIDQRRAGRMPQSAAVQWASRKRRIGDLTTPLAEFGRENLRRLDERRWASARASAVTFWIVLLTGAFLSLGLSSFLMRYVIRPQQELASQARAWRIGKPWPGIPHEAAREVRSLARTLGRLTARAEKQYEKESELVRLKTQLVSIVSHDFNNTLGVIQGGLSLLFAEGRDLAPEKRRKYHDMLQSNIRQLAAECASLLQLGRVESGRFRLRRRPTEARLMLRECMENLALLFERKEQTVRLEAPEEPVAVDADPEALNVVVTNLVTNAHKYTPKGGVIVLRVEARGESVLIAVEDTGIGIAEADREKIFEGYFRTEEGKRQAKGHGVGLALVRRMVEEHGSRLELVSEPGRGSKFSFLLPRAAATGGAKG